VITWHAVAQGVKHDGTTSRRNKHWALRVPATELSTVFKITVEVDQ
jgi:hypothetical protein